MILCGSKNNPALNTIQAYIAVFAHFLILSPKHAISSNRFWTVMTVSWTMWIFSIKPLLSDS